MTFARAGFSSDAAIEHMREAVRIAHRGREQYMNDHPDRQIKIALSLGPLGAMLQPAQEYSGNYPALYGSTGGDASLLALTQFHLERLEVFASDPSIWKLIDIVAFETVPLPQEALAIRKAMRSLARDLSSSTNSKPWWISFVSAEEDAALPSKTIEKFHAALDPASEDIGLPSAIGINCIDIKRISTILQAVKDVCEGRRVTLVVYPNGGWDYDSSTKLWHQSSEDTAEEVWCTSLLSAIEQHREDWSGIIVGGCCKCHFAHISRLREAVNEKIIGKEL
jgi:homocysteine S-methyltransferase